MYNKRRIDCALLLNGVNLMSVIAYFDESGDDGLINYSSETFILSATYIHTNDWNENYNLIKKFRKYLKDKYNIPIKEEFHTANFFSDKYPYRNYDLTTHQRNSFFIC